MWLHASIVNNYIYIKVESPRPSCQTSALFLRHDSDDDEDDDTVGLSPIIVSEEGEFEGEDFATHRDSVSEDDDDDGSVEDTEEVSAPPFSPISVTSVDGCTTEWFGYKFVGDNIDKNVKASLQRLDHSNKSYHFFHGYAVRDRVDLSTYSDDKPEFHSPDASSLLPSNLEISLLKEELTILIARLVINYCWLNVTCFICSA